jgi:hypothetical protein
LVDGEWFKHLLPFLFNGIPIILRAELPRLSVMGNSALANETPTIKTVTWQTSYYGHEPRKNKFICYPCFICENGVIPYAINKIEFDQEGR